MSSSWVRPESSVERAAVRAARRLGVPAPKFSPAGSVGWPDRIFLLPGGRPLLVEFKRPGMPLTPQQRRVHARLRRLGYDVEVWRDADHARRWLAFRLCGCLHEQRKRIAAGLPKNARRR